jgi:hypothetical protein
MDRAGEVADIRSAALEVLKHRHGNLPGAGWLLDNGASRAALAALAAAVSATPAKVQGAAPIEAKNYVDQLDFVCNPPAAPTKTAEGSIADELEFTNLLVSYAEAYGDESDAEDDNSNQYRDAKGALVTYIDTLLAARKTAPAKLDALESCSAEEVVAFESWAKTQKYDMTTHPLHWLFLDPATYAARQGWKNGLAFARDAITTQPGEKA